jgi:putative ABC transport system permease protein
MLNQEMDKLGANIFMFWVNEEYREGDFTLADVSFLKQTVPTVKYLSPVSYQSASVQGARGTEQVNIIGTNSDYARANNLALLKGRFISEDDEAAGRPVIVIEEDTAEKLLGYSEPLGKRIILSGNSVTVVGVLKKEPSMFDSGSSQTVYVPITSLTNLTGQTFIAQLVGSSSNREDLESTLQTCKVILERRHNAPGHYRAYNMEEEIQSINKITP